MKIINKFLRGWGYEKFLMLFLGSILVASFCLGMQGDGKEPYVAMEVDEVDSKPLFDLVDNFMRGKVGDEVFEAELERLLAAGVNINAQNAKGQPLMCHAILSSLGMAADLKTMLKPDEHLFFTGDNLTKRKLAREKCLSVLRVLDNHDADILVYTEKTRSSPLHIAVTIGEKEIISFLLKSKSYKKSDGKALLLPDTKHITPNQLSQNLYLGCTNRHSLLKLNRSKAPESQRKAFAPGIKKAHQLETCYREIREMLVNALSDIGMPDFSRNPDEQSLRLLEAKDSVEGQM